MERFANNKQKNDGFIFSTTESTLTTNSSDDRILTVLDQQLDNFSLIENLILSKSIKPGNLFLPQTLKAIEFEITSSAELYVELLGFNDIINTFSLLYYGNYDYFFTEMCNSIVSNRVMDNVALSMCKEQTDDFVFTSETDTLRFLQSNKYLVVIYIYSLIYTIFFRENNE